MTVKMALLNAATIIEDNAWTDWTCALDADGESCPPRSAGAVAFCAMGALDRATGGDAGVKQAAVDAMRDHEGFGGWPGGVFGWNRDVGRDVVVTAMRSTAGALNG